MTDWFEVDNNVNELIENWRWEQPVSMDKLCNLSYSDKLKNNNDSYDPSLYNYSYSEWRKRRSYYRTQRDEYYKDFIGTLMPLRHGDSPSLHPNKISQNNLN